MPDSGPAFFAVDVGGSWVKSGLVVNGRADEIAKEPVARELDALVEQLNRLSAGRHWGLCVAGLVDPSAGVLRYSANLGLRDAPLVQLLETEPVVFANDLDAAAVGEADGGTLALLQIGTGIAGRFVVDGHVLPSATGLAGEVGHLRFRDDGLRCTCGRTGCAEAYGSWGALAGRHPAAAEPSDLPPDVVADAYEAIGFAAAALVATCDPGRLRIGGGLAAAWGETLLEAVRRELSERILPDVAAATAVERGRLGDAAALVGLARSAR